MISSPRSRLFQPSRGARARDPVRGAGALALLLLTLLTLLPGCNEHLAGTHDVELTYAIQGEVPAPVEKSLEIVRGHVIERLAVAHVTADVIMAAPNLAHVTVDASSTNDVDAALRAPNGLVLYRAADDVDFTPSDMTGLTKIPAAPGARGTTVQGAAEAVVRAVLATKPREGTRALVACDQMPSCRVVVVDDPAAFDLSAEVESTSLLDHGRKVAVVVKSDAVARARKEHASEPWVVARGRTALARQAIPEDGRLVLGFGDDIYAYTRAEQAHALLAAHPLPPMKRTNARELPPSFGLAVLGLLLPLLASLAWLSFVRRFDRAHPEPSWLVLATFALGGLSVIPAGLAEYGCMRATPYLNPSVMSLGGQPLAFPLVFVVFTLVVGMSEEGSKLLGAWSLARHRREFDEPIDGIVYGTASALGFAAVENVKYFAVGRLASSIVVMRSLTSVPVHMFFGAIWGYALGRKLISKKTSVLLYLLWAAAMHGGFDASLSVRGFFPFALALQVLLALLFVHFLRKSLRYGVVTPDGHAPPASSQRLAFTMGSMSTFLLWVVLLLVLAVGLVFVGGYFELSHHRLSYAFLSIAVSLLATMGLAAHGVAGSVPLDAVIDIDGVTFAGTQRAWSTVTGLERRRSRSAVLGRAEDLVVRSTAGDLCIGPARGPAMEILHGALAARLGL